MTQSIVIQSINNIYPEVGVVYLEKRKEYIMNTLTKMNIKVTIPFPAILGSKLNKKQLIQDGIVHKDCKLRINEIACALSHFALIRKFYNESQNENIMIFEDDIAYNDTYYKKMTSLRIPRKFDMLQYGHCWDVCNTKKKVVNTDVYITDNPLCCHSYAISKTGAKKILDNCFPILLPLDVFYVNMTENNGFVSRLTKIFLGKNIKNSKTPFVIFTVYPRLFNQLKGEPENQTGLIASNLGNDDMCLECKEHLITTKTGIKLFLGNFYITLFIIILFLIYIKKFF
jgi:hypothetical protein